MSFFLAASCLFTFILPLNSEINLSAILAFWKEVSALSWNAASICCCASENIENCLRISLSKNTSRQLRNASLKSRSFFQREMVSFLTLSSFATSVAESPEQSRTTANCWRSLRFDDISYYHVVAVCHESLCCSFFRCGNSNKLGLLPWLCSTL